MKTTRFQALPGISTLSLLLLILALLIPSPLGAQNSRSSMKNFQHVFIIMMENTGFDALIGNPNASFINAAASQYGLATNYFGVTHPSQPNYIAATSGSTNGVTSDSDTTINVANIVDQLEANGKTWKAYMQSFSLCSTPLDHACGIQLYERNWLRWLCRTRKSSMVCCFAPALKPSSKWLETPDISAPRSASSACCIPGIRNCNFIPMSTASSRRVGSPAIAPAGFTLVLDSFSPSTCSDAYFAGSSSPG